MQVKLAEWQDKSVKLAQWQNDYEISRIAYYQNDRMEAWN